MKTSITPLLGLCLLLAGGAVVQAQAPVSRPTVSPYQNLYRGGNSPNRNYYDLVRPELDFRSSLQQLQQQNQATQQSISELQTPAGPLVTGHQAGFMTHQNYFQTHGNGGTGGAAGFGTAGRRPAGGRR
jgi:hypothetical protein